jgi:hypothetical protein
VVGSVCGIILTYYPGIRLEELRKPTKISIRIAGRQSRDLNPGSSEYEAGVNHTMLGKEEVRYEEVCYTEITLKVVYCLRYLDLTHRYKMFREYALLTSSGD